jgi:hypothetical protein
MTGELEEDVIAKLLKLAREGVPADRIAQTMLLPLNWVEGVIDGDRYAKRANQDSENIKNS